MVDGRYGAGLSQTRCNIDCCSNPLKEINEFYNAHFLHHWPAEKFGMPFAASSQGIKRLYRSRLFLSEMVSPARASYGAGQ
jgi:hypothetical protein